MSLELVKQMKASPEVYDHFNDPRHAGPLDSPDVEGYGDLGGKAPRVTFQCCLDGDAITDVGYRVFGCGFLIACCSVAATSAHQRSKDIALALTAEQIDEVLHLPNERKFCADIVVRAVRDAFADEG